MTTRQSRTPGRHSAGLPEASFDEVSVISFKGAQAGVEEFALGNDDDVKPWRNLVSTKNLSNQSFSSISLNRAANLTCGGDAEPPHTPLVGQNEDGAVAAVEPDTPLVDLLELSAPANVLGWTESHTSTRTAQL